MKTYPHILFFANRKGLTLTEIVIAMFAFAIISAGVLAGVTQARKMAESNVRENNAVAVAGGFMEQLLATDYTVVRRASNPTATDSDRTLRFVIRDGEFLDVLANSGDWVGPLRIPIGVGEDDDFDRYMNFWMEVELAPTTDGLPSLSKTVRYKWSDPFSRRDHIRQISVVRAAATTN